MVIHFIEFIGLLTRLAHKIDISSIQDVLITDSNTRCLIKNVYIVFNTLNPVMCCCSLLVSANGCSPVILLTSWAELLYSFLAPQAISALQISSLGWPALLGCIVFPMSH